MSTAAPFRRAGRAAAALAWIVAIAGGCADGTGPDPDAGCEGPLCNRAALDALGLDPFYRKYLDADGIPVIGSERVADEALHAAREIVHHMLRARPEVRQAMIVREARVGVMAVTEVTTDIPEHRFLADDPAVDWDKRARGLGGTPAVPITTGAEENLLCLAGDTYRNENILVHEFAHGMHLLGIDFVEAAFTAELQAVYDSALAEGLWANTYAATNAREYWAEGVQSWLDGNPGPISGIQNHINTRAELQAADPRLAALIARFLPTDDWRPSCPE